MKRNPKNKKPKQLELKIKSWGGKRKGAGRPNKSGGINHHKRENITEKTPLHITQKVKLPIHLRTKEILKIFRESIGMAKDHGLNVIHFSIQGNHLHFIGESKSNKSLADGMKSLGGRFAKLLRAKFGGNGSVFKGRYHLHVLKTPTEMKRALEYVLLNSAKHKDVIEHIDPYSSGSVFRDWKKLVSVRLSGLLEEDVYFFSELRKEVFPELSPPRSWLGTIGWQRAS